MALYRSELNGGGTGFDIENPVYERTITGIVPSNERRLYTPSVNSVALIMAKKTTVMLLKNNHEYALSSEAIEQYNYIFAIVPKGCTIYAYNTSADAQVRVAVWEQTN